MHRSERSMAYFRHFGSLLVNAPSIVSGLNHSRGATISAAIPSPSRRRRSSLASLRTCASVFASMSGTASSSWNIIASNPSALSWASFQPKSRAGRVGGP